jgi:hypothetical protein
MLNKVTICIMQPSVLTRSLDSKFAYTCIRLLAGEAKSSQVVDFDLQSVGLWSRYQSSQLSRINMNFSHVTFQVALMCVTLVLCISVRWTSLFIYIFTYVLTQGLVVRRTVTRRAASLKSTAAVFRRLFRASGCTYMQGPGHRKLTGIQRSTTFVGLMQCSAL